MSGRRAALRIARRDGLRSPGRSLLIALMIAIPVSGAAFIDVVLRTVDVRGPERIPLELGSAADARVLPQPQGEAILQAPDGTFGYQPSGAAGSVPMTTEPVPATDPLPLLPRGSRAITDQVAEVQVRTTDGLARSRFRELDVADPIAAGLFTTESGRAPQAEDEVAVTGSLLEVLGLAVGDRLEVTNPARGFAIVGTVRPASDADGTEVAVGLPGALLDAPGQDDLSASQPVSYLVDTPAPVTWQQVLAFNDRGVAVFSRAVVEDPPPDAEVPLLADPSFAGGGGLDAATLVAGVLVVGLAVFEVALLAGSAFAVGARRQSRSLGLLAATGGTRGQVRSVVMFQGLVLGVVGGLTGVLLGTGVGSLAVYVLSTRFDVYLPSPDLRPLELLALTAVGVLTGLLAAVLPARGAARQDVVAALSGRRGVIRTRRRLPVVGLVLAGVGAGAAVGGGALALAQGGTDGGDTRALALAAALILGGAVLSQVGLIVSTPAIIGGAARLGRFLPLPPRLALRDAARHRNRSTPAVAAVLGAVAGSVALTVFVAALSDKDEREYRPSLGYGQALLPAASGPGAPPRAAGSLLAAVAAVAPPDSHFDVTSFPADCVDLCTYVSVVATPENRCPLDAVSAAGTVLAPPELDQLAGDPRCSNDESVFLSSPFPGPVVGDYDAFVQLLGIESGTARKILDRGGVVVFDRDQVTTQGSATLETSAFDQTTGATQVRSVEVPAAYVQLQGRGYVSAFVSPAAAAATGVPTAVEATVVQYDVPPDDDTEEAITAALARQGEVGQFQVERGYRDEYGIGLLALLFASAAVTLGAAGVATGLAQADARGDLATLAAVGAPPGVRRVLTAFQALVVAGLGALLGTASGLVPMLGYLYADPDMRFVAPWVNLLVITIAVPLTAALCAGLLTPSRLPLARRLA